MPTDPADSTSRRGSTYGFLLRPKWIAFHLLVIAWSWRWSTSGSGSCAASTSGASSTPRCEQQHPAAGPARRRRPASPIRRRSSGGRSRSPAPTAEHQFLVVNRSQNGDTGDNVVAPCDLGDGRCCSSTGVSSRSSRIPHRCRRAPVEVVGRLRASEQRNGPARPTPTWRAHGDPPDRHPGLLAGQFDAHRTPMYVDLLESDSTRIRLARAGHAPTPGEGPHLSYTIQWFIFSAVLAVGWVLAVRRSSGDSAVATPAKDEAGLTSRSPTAKRRSDSGQPALRAPPSGGTARRRRATA